MIIYQEIAALVNQISADTWEILREIKERRPAMMLSELIHCRRPALQQQEPVDPGQCVRPITPRSSSSQRRKH